MTIEPPSDMSRAERKAFRQHVEKLDKSGVDVALRVDILCDFVRLETRLKDLRNAEKLPENAGNLAVSRALNTATSERRRLHEQLYRGASLKPRTKAERVEKAMAANAVSDIDLVERDEAWRDLVWWLARGKPEPEAGAREALEAKYGPCGMTPMIFAYAEEQRGWRALMEASGNNPSSGQIQALREQMPHKCLTPELRSPGMIAKLKRERGLS